MDIRAPLARATKDQKEQGIWKTSMKKNLKFYCRHQSIENTYYISEVLKKLRI